MGEMILEETVNGNERDICEEPLDEMQRYRELMKHYKSLLIHTGHIFHIFGREKSETYFADLAMSYVKEIEGLVDKMERGERLSEEEISTIRKDCKFARRCERPSGKNLDGSANGMEYRTIVDYAERMFGKRE